MKLDHDGRLPPPTNVLPRCYQETRHYQHNHTRLVVFIDCKDAFDTNDDADWIFFDDGQNIDTLIIYILMMMGDVDIVMMLAADTVDDDTL